MRSKVAVIASLLFVLVIGAAALAVNTRILDTSPRPDIGRANELLAPNSASPTAATGVPAAPADQTAPPPPRSDDGPRDNHYESEELDDDFDD
ncbi:hypothetical protein ORI20_26775 [Mycobacterium sp. CVI_P3]|uniref:Uncharacterized protein n=1 Tax=Mycobacterium pinniadriaticum TaxID=2994102 RepID=A0ABT3SL61_9MYCO|nr:hypothetical protein [Mycobacterium pinniadriaticum]MCX2933881.1 hypothetical protein [Mycobacterium pinniadriaticum]MCX2940266.1 hypothetical protein [Mycobacterium pinniadriaticum]